MFKLIVYMCRRLADSSSEAPSWFHSGEYIRDIIVSASLSYKLLGLNIILVPQRVSFQKQIGNLQERRPSRCKANIYFHQVEKLACQL